MLLSKYLSSGISAGLCLLCSASVLADHPTLAFGSEASGAINTISTTEIPVGTWGYGLRSEVIKSDKFSTGQLEDFAASGREGVHSVDSITNTSFSLLYGATENLSISARLPYIKRENIREGELEDGLAEAHTHGDSSGMGDLLLLGQYRVIPQANFDTSILFGLKAPTGDTDVKDDDGLRFETEFQPGSGSWDYLLGLSLSKSVGNFGYHFNALYNKTTQGSQATEIGDAFSYNAALTYRLGESHATHKHTHIAPASDIKLNWDFSIELNGQTRRKNKISGASEDNSGGTIMFLSPGIRVTSKALSGFLSYGIPIQQDQNGRQTDVDGRIVAGFSLVL